MEEDFIRKAKESLAHAGGLMPKDRYSTTIQIQAATFWVLQAQAEALLAIASELGAARLGTRS